MLDSLMDWLISTPINGLVLNYAWSWPTLESLHFLALCTLMGSLMIMDLRLIGFNRLIPLQALRRFFALAWLGFGINFVSGSFLFSAQATSYIVDWVFMTKMTLVLLGAVTAGILQPAVAKVAPGAQLSGGTKSIAGVAIVVWVVAIVMGRLTAYL